MKLASLYPLIFKYLKEGINYPEEYILQFIEAHGKLFDPSTTVALNFMNSITDAFSSQTLLRKIAEMPFFIENLRDLTFEIPPSYSGKRDEFQNRFRGVMKIIENIWITPKTIESYPNILEIYAILLTKLFNAELIPILPHAPSFLNNFVNDSITHFNKLIKNYMVFNLDPSVLPTIVPEVVKLVETYDAEEGDPTIDSYFINPQSRDSTGALNLGGALRNSFKAGLKEYKKYLDMGHTFSYDTYKTLIANRYLDKEIIIRSFETVPDFEETKKLANLIVKQCNLKQIDELIIPHPLFKDKILPLLNPISLLKLAKYTASVKEFISVINFPHNFKSISSQVEFHETIAFLYKKLFVDLKDYSTIIEYNEVCPIVDLEILLLSCIRSGTYEQFEVFFNKYKNSPELKGKVSTIEAKYLINLQEIDSAIKLLETNECSSERSIDLMTFALFLKSFTEDVRSDNASKKVMTTLQLANLLSSQNSFAHLLSVYEVVINGKPANSHHFLTDPSANVIILDQMLNNLHDALQFIDCHDTIAREMLSNKMKIFFRFKALLKLPQFKMQDMEMLIHIWSVTKPHEIVCLFNNIFETIRLNPALRRINLSNDLMFDYTPTGLETVLNHIETSFEDTKDEEGLRKMEKLKVFIKKN